MTIRVKGDEDVPTAFVELLRAAGYEDTLGVLEQGMGGWKDPQL
jgi:hypothetical protein